MRDAIAELDALLREVGARPTLDRLRNFTHPCYSCGTTAEPRELVEIGRYTRPRIGGSCQVGDAITRPLCERCRQASVPPPPEHPNPTGEPCERPCGSPVCGPAGGGCTKGPAR